MAVDIHPKLEAVAQMLDGRINQADGAPAVCVQGYIAGFPCRLEAISPNWPFGVSYSVNTEVVPGNTPAREVFSLTATPRIGKGLFGFITRLLFFESAGVKIQDKNLQKALIFNCSNRSALERFVEYPGIAEALIKLHELSFNELKIISNAGLYLSQPKSFAKLELPICRQVFNLMAEIGQVLYERF